MVVLAVPPRGTTKHSNEVYIETLLDDDYIDSITWNGSKCAPCSAKKAKTAGIVKYRDYDIHKDQPWDWPPSWEQINNGKGANITFKAGRESSEGAAKHWKNHLDNSTDKGNCSACAQGYEMVPVPNQRAKEESYDADKVDAKGCCTGSGQDCNPGHLNFWFCGKIKQRRSGWRNFCIGQGHDGYNNWYMAMKIDDPHVSIPEAPKCLEDCALDGCHSLGFYPKAGIV